MQPEYDEVFAKIRELEKTIPLGKWKYDKGVNELSKASKILLSIIAELYKRGQQGKIYISDLPEDSKRWIKKEIAEALGEILQ